MSDNDGDQRYSMDMAAEPVPLSKRNMVQYNKQFTKDGWMDWLKAMMEHSFVLGNEYESYITTMRYIEGLIREHREMGDRSRLKALVPSIGFFHTDLHLVEAFDQYNAKYSITARKHIKPSFHEIRHILNLAQILAINVNLKLITFDGDQTLYSDGGNFEENSGLSYQIIELLKAGVWVSIITAANYQDNGPLYEIRLSGLLKRFVKVGLSEEVINRFLVMGGECHYLLRAEMVDGAARLMPIPHTTWQADNLGGPQPINWSSEARDNFLDIAEASFRLAQSEMKIRGRILRKVTSVGMIPGGEKMIAEYPTGHGNAKIKTEVLNEVIQRALADIRRIEAPLPFPYCAFNGGRDCWVDVGSKGVGVATLQAFLKVSASQCMHVGDQFIQTGNDFATRETSTTIWIENPNETYKILDHVLRFSLGADKMERAERAKRAEDMARDAPSPRIGAEAASAPPSARADGAAATAAASASAATVFSGSGGGLSLHDPSNGPAKVMNVYTGEME